LDVKNSISFNPFGLLDPKPVFNWSVTIALDNDTDSIILTIGFAYDHNNNSAANALDDVVGIIAGVLTAGILGPVVGISAGTESGVAAGIAVGASLNQAYDSSVNNKILDFLARDLDLQYWTKTIRPITFTATHPTTQQYSLSMSVQFDPSTYNEIRKYTPATAGALSLVVSLLRTII
jgi:hypothetical protein